MDKTRTLLFVSLGLILFAIYGEWQVWERQKLPPPQAMQPGAGTPAVPAVPASATGAVPVAAPDTSIAQGERIEVVTDIYTAVIDTHGGDLRKLALTRYPVAADKPGVPLNLLSDEPATFHIAQSGLIGHTGTFPTHRTRFEAAAHRYILAEGQAELRVPLMYRSKEGVLYTKTYVFRRNDYVVDVEFKVENHSRQEWQGFFYGQLARVGVETPGMFALPTYTGAAVYTPTEKYEKIAFDDIAKQTTDSESVVRDDVTGGWVAMLQHYFVGSWMPNAEARSRFWSKRLADNRFVIGYTALEPSIVAPGTSAVIAGRLYLGPKEQRRLEKLTEGMELTVDYGVLTIISAPLFWLLDQIHSLIGNWGWAIVILTILIKIVFFPLSAASYKSMAKMKKVAPRMQALKERYANDRQKLNQAMMEMYQTEKINPLGGCLPILIQIPVFIALYWVLLESVEMRQAPWLLWISDLSAQDPYYVLPIVMGVTMYAQQMLNPQPMDPVQQKVFMVMPGIFTVLFLFFPAGLVLYWTVNNLLSIAQQWQINRTHAETGD